MRHRLFLSFDNREPLVSSWDGVFQQGTRCDGAGEHVAAAASARGYLGMGTPPGKGCAVSLASCADGRCEQGMMVKVKVRNLFLF